MSAQRFLVTVSLAMAAGSFGGDVAWGQVVREWGLEGATVTDLSSTRGAGVGSTLHGRTMTRLTFGLGLGRVVGVSDLSVGVQFLALVGSNGSDGLGDAQGFSNIDASPGVGLAELWLEWAPVGGPLRVKVGKADVNADFAAVSAAGGFVNSSAGYSPTILGIPTYPDPAVGAGVFLNPLPRLSLNVGFFNGGGPNGSRGDRPGFSAFGGNNLFDETFWIGEAGVHWGSEKRAGRASVGGWRHSGEFERGESRTESGTAGFFATAEQRFAPGVSAFLQYGRADPSVSEIETHAALGVYWEPLGPDAEALGAMVTVASLTTPRLAREVVAEVFYRLRVNQHLAVQPELQYIVNPGGDPSRASAVVLLLRVESGFAAGRARE